MRGAALAEQARRWGDTAAPSGLAPAEPEVDHRRAAVGREEARPGRPEAAASLAAQAMRGAEVERARAAPAQRQGVEGRAARPRVARRGAADESDRAEAEDRSGPAAPADRPLRQARAASAEGVERPARAARAAAQPAVVRGPSEAARDQALPEGEAAQESGARAEPFSARP